MKKYIMPEINLIEIEATDVITASGSQAGAKAIEKYLNDNGMTTDKTTDLGDIDSFDSSWIW